MAPLPARITAADFLTPPEFRGRPLAAEGSGRVGGVRLRLTAEAGVTRLGACYQQVPLRVLPPFGFGPGRPVLLYVLNPTAGLFDGDGQLVEVCAEAGAASEVAVQQVGERWAAAGREVDVVAPRAGSDLNDALMMETAR